MLAPLRYEYFLVGDQVVETMVRRPPHASKWQFNTRRPNLIAVIEPTSDSFELREGFAATTDLVVEAVQRFQGTLADPAVPDAGKDVPPELAEEIGVHIERAIGSAVSQFRSFAEETDITGYLKGGLGSGELTRDGWTVQLSAWTYSRRPKEHKHGADIGLIVDLTTPRGRVVKALWFQAKKIEDIPTRIAEIHELPEQMKKMRAQTTDAYAMFYGPTDISVFQDSDLTHKLSMRSVVSDAIVCKRGDRTPKFVALTADSKTVLDVLVKKTPESDRR